MIDYKRFENGVVRFLDTEMLTKMEDPLKRVLLGAIVIASQQKAKSLFDYIKDNQIIKAYEIIDGENIDIDLLYHCLKESMKDQTIKMNLPLQLGTATITSADLDRLYTYITQG